MAKNLMGVELPHYDGYLAAHATDELSLGVATVIHKVFHLVGNSLPWLNAFSSSLTESLTCFSDNLSE